MHQRSAPGRVIAKPYLPGEEIFTDTGTRAGLLMARILALPEDEVARVLGETLANFSARHRNFAELLERHFARYVSMNSVTETVLRSQSRGEINRWTPNWGTRPTL